MSRMSFLVFCNVVSGFYIITRIFISVFIDIIKLELSTRNCLLNNQNFISSGNKELCSVDLFRLKRYCLGSKDILV